MAGVAPASPYLVYLHKLTDGTVFYVGKGREVRATQERHRSIWWKNKVNKHGAYVVEIVFRGNAEECLLEEIRLIALYRSQGLELVNLTAGGEGSLGYSRPVSEQQKTAIRRTLTGRKQHPDAVANRSAALRKQTPEQLERRRVALRAVPHTAEWNEKARLGYTAYYASLTPEQKAARSRINSEAQKRYHAAKRAAPCL